MSVHDPLVPRLTRLLIADGNGFVSRDVAMVEMNFTGIVGDLHAGATRPADARTPWHARRTRIANTRQVSLVAEEECADIATLLDIEAIDAALLGANVVVSGIPDFSLLPAATRLQFPSGATLFVTEQNAPCRYPAEKLADTHGMPRLVSGFAKAAIGRRGLVALVEREGRVAVGDEARCLPSPARVERPRLEAPGLLRRP